MDLLPLNLTPPRIGSLAFLAGNRPHLWRKVLSPCLVDHRHWRRELRILRIFLTIPLRRKRRVLCEPVDGDDRLGVFGVLPLRDLQRLKG
jgi:hypothetical protein